MKKDETPPDAAPAAVQLEVPQDEAQPTPLRLIPPKQAISINDLEERFVLLTPSAESYGSVMIAAERSDAALRLAHEVASLWTRGLLSSLAVVLEQHVKTRRNVCQAVVAQFAYSLMTAGEALDDWKWTHVPVIRHEFGDDTPGHHWAEHLGAGFDSAWIIDTGGIALLVQSEGVLHARPQLIDRPMESRTFDEVRDWLRHGGQLFPLDPVQSQLLAPWRRYLLEAAETGDRQPALEFWSPRGTVREGEVIPSLEDMLAGRWAELFRYGRLRDYRRDPLPEPAQEREAALEKHAPRLFLRS